MYLLVDICANENLQPVWSLVGIIINIIWKGIPIILIILGSIDLGKAVISSKEDEVKKAKKAFINRLLYAAAVFAVVWLVTLLLDNIGKLGLTGADQNVTSGWKACWEQIRNK